MGKKIIRLTESDLHRIVKESVERILSEDTDEAWNKGQLANLAGQANGATSTLGGKIKGLFNPKWAARKKRQEQLFGNTAAGNGYDYRNSVTDDNTIGNYDTSMDLPGNNYTYDNGGNSDWVGNTFKAGNQENPFQLRRYHNIYTPTRSSDGRTIGQTSTPSVDDGRTYSRSEFSDEFINPQTNPTAQNAAMDLRSGNSGLNRAYAQGRKAAMGKKMTNTNGENLGGTGTNNGAFRRLGKLRR